MRMTAVVAMLASLLALLAACEKKEAHPRHRRADGAARPRPSPKADTGPIKVGILHSLSGTMAISETVAQGRGADDHRGDQRKGGVLGRSSSRWWWTRRRTGRCSPRRRAQLLTRTRSR